MQKDPEFIKFLGKCQWALDASMSAKEAHTFLSGCPVETGAQSRAPRRIVPVVMSCDRDPCYLPATLFSIYQSGFSPPIISHDTVKSGPGEAMVKIADLMNSILQKSADGTIFMLFQDDAWATPASLMIAKTFYPNSAYSISLYRMTPLTQEQFDHLKDSQETTDTGITYYETHYLQGDTVRYNGGCGFMFPGALIKSGLFRNRLRRFSALPMPQQIGKATLDSGEPHYATASNLIEHIGEVSSLPGRPEWFRMPVSSTVSAIAKHYMDHYGEYVKCPQMS